MTLAMRHPMTGETVLCAEYDGTQHDQHHAVAVARWMRCEICGDHFETCVLCEVVIGCCGCGAYHAWECPWPL